MQSLLQKLLDATRLTRGGSVAEATALIQRALADASESAGATPLTINPATGKVRTLHGKASAVASRLASALPRQAGRVDAPEVTPASRASATPRGAEMPADRPFRRTKAGAHFSASYYTGESGTRSYKLFEPDGLEGRRVPLVVMLHGCTQDPDDFAAGTRMNELAAAQGFLVLYPAQAPRSNVSKCWNWYVPEDQRRGRGEPDLLAGMTRHVMATHAVDPDRVYVAGLSAGGAMAAILGREYPDLFAAVGVHSGLPPGAAHDVASAFSAMKGSAPTVPGVASMLSDMLQPPGFASNRRIDAPAANAPTIAFHGDRDHTVHPSNGERVIDALLDKATGTASVEAHVEPEPDGAYAERRVTRTVYRAPGAKASRAEHWLVHGAGHAWAGGSHSGTYTDPSGPDASREMLRFFEEHPRAER